MGRTALSSVAIVNGILRGTIVLSTTRTCTSVTMTILVIQKRPFTVLSAIGVGTGLTLLLTAAIRTYSTGVVRGTVVTPVTGAVTRVSEAVLVVGKTPASWVTTSERVHALSTDRWRCSGFWTDPSRHFRCTRVASITCTVTSIP